MPLEMKGLVQFLTDVRNAKTEEAEDRRIQAELVHIQKQFQQKGAKMSGYDRRKYVCKLMYIQMLGNRLEFGLDQVILLMRSKNYGEKTVGYQAINVWVTQDHETLDHDQWEDIFESIDADLASNGMQNVCCGIQSVADLCEYNTNVFPQRYEVRVFSALRSPEFDVVVHRKAALCLMKLIKADNGGVLARHREYVSRTVPMVSSDDLGLVLSLAPLLETMARYDYEGCQHCITLAVGKLSELTLERKCPPEYFFHGTAAPFVTVSLFRLLEILVPESNTASLDNANRDKLAEIIQVSVRTSIASVMNPDATQEARDVAGSVLFGALSLAAHVNSPSDPQSAVAADALCGMLQSPDVNARYLALGALLQLAARNDVEFRKVVDPQIDKVGILLRDRDVSVRRRAMDLIYMLCTSENVEKTCDELIKYLEIAEFSIKPEVAVKVAVLAEKYATDAVWFVMTILKLLSLAGNCIDDDVWQRMAQIVVNNDNIQATACRTIVRYLKTNEFPESMLKLGSFLLSEFGEKITDTTSLKDQFQLLYGSYGQASILTRAMLLTAFLKFYRLCPDLRGQIRGIFNDEANSFAPEIQQRAMEYLGIIKLGNPEVIKIVTAEMPPFTSESSPLIERLGTVHELKQSFKLAPRLPTTSARSSSPSVTPTSLSPQATRQGIRSGRSSPERLLSTSEARLVPPQGTGNSSKSNLLISPVRSTVLKPSVASPAARAISPTRPPPPPSRKNRGIGSRPTSSLFSNEQPLSEMSTGSSGTSRRSLALSQASSSNIVASAGSTTLTTNTLSPSWREGYYRLCKFDQGIFYENSMLRIVYRLKRARSKLHVTLTFSNKSPHQLTGLTSQVAVSPNVASLADHPYSIEMLKHPDTTIAEGGRTNQQFDVSLQAMFADKDAPILTVSFLAGGLTTLRLRLPIILVKAISPGAPLTKLDFFMRWQQISQALGAQGEFQQTVQLAKATNLGRLAEHIGFDNLKQVDDNESNVVGAGILNLTSGVSAVFMRMEPNPADPTQVRITVKSTTPGMASTVGASITHIAMN